jgi:hypothetical protein
MDILVFSVGDMRVGIPFDQVALGIALNPLKITTDTTGSGRMEAALTVVDLRKKFNFQPISGEKGVQTIVVKREDRVLGLIVNRSSEARYVPDVKVVPFSGVDYPFLAGVVAAQDDMILIFDWDHLLESDTVVDINDLFSRPTGEETVSPSTRFLDGAMRIMSDSGALDRIRIRQLAEKHDIPLSVAWRLISFYRPRRSDEHDG